MSTPAARDPMVALLLLGVAALAGPLSAWSATTPERFFTIGTGQVGGTYYPLGRAICDLVNREREVHGYRCSVDPTQGSVENVTAMRKGESDFAILQADVHYQTFEGTGRWAGQPQPELRSVLSLYPELATILSPPGAITETDDLLGVRVNVGQAASGGRATWDLVMEALGKEQNAVVSQFRPQDANAMLCAGEIDASVLMVGHPSGVVANGLAKCRLDFFPMSVQGIDRILAERPYFQRGVISGEDYGLDGFVPTFGVSATLVTQADTDDDLVALVTGTVIDHLDEIQELMPTLRGVEVRDMVEGGLTAPRHPAARRALQERDLLE